MNDRRIIRECITNDWNNAGNGLAWQKSYVYLGSRLLSTATNNGANTAEVIEFHHADRLGTRLVTNPQSGTSFTQSTLPFGNALNSESTGATNRRFTSYDRSSISGLDYAQNRTYDSGQGRFTTVDPSGMAAANLASPQSLNMYAYVENDPVNMVDPSGLLIAAPQYTEVCGYIINNDGSRISTGCTTTFVGYEFIDIGNDPVINVTNGDPYDGGISDRINKKELDPIGNAIILEASDSHKNHCKSLSRGIKSHIKQAQRHLDNYGTDFEQWVSPYPPFNYLTGQLRDYQNHVDEAKRLSDQYNNDCNDQGPPPDVPAFENVPFHIRESSKKTTFERIMDNIPSLLPMPTNREIDKEMKKMFPRPGGFPVSPPFTPVYP